MGCQGARLIRSASLSVLSRSINRSTPVLPSKFPLMIRIQSLESNQNEMTPSPRVQAAMPSAKRSTPRPHAFPNSGKQRRHETFTSFEPTLHLEAQPRDEPVPDARWLAGAVFGCRERALAGDRGGLRQHLEHVRRLDGGARVRRDLGGVRGPLPPHRRPRALPDVPRPLPAAFPPEDEPLGGRDHGAVPAPPGPGHGPPGEPPGGEPAYAA